jgi:MSHA biogenesis protein MshN
MSVINQVLLELEKRRATGTERGRLPDHVRALPDGSGGHLARGWWIAAAGGAGLVLLAIAVLATDLHGLLRLPLDAAKPQSATAAVIEEVVAASAAGLAAERARVASGEAAAGSTPPVGRLSFELAHAPQPEPAPAPEAARQPAPIPTSRITAPAGPDSAEDTTNARRPAAGASGDGRQPAAVATTKTPAPVKGGNAGIEKTVRQPTARELADVEYRKGAGLLQQARLPEALEAFRTAVSLHPPHHSARQAIVALLLESKRHAEAERVLLDGLKLAPEQTGFAMALARLQLERGDAAAATGTLKDGLPHAQGRADYAAFLAALLQRQGRHDEAIEQFQAALRASPTAGVWWLGLGMSLQAARRVAEAQEAFRRAKSTNNLNPELAAFADQRLRQLQ